MKFTVFGLQRDIVSDNPSGLYLALGHLIIVGLLWDNWYVGLMILNRLLGWEHDYQEQYSD